MKDKRTIIEWAESRGYVILDPDGFDRSDPKLWENMITEEEFVKGFGMCTVQKIEEAYGFDHSKRRV